MDALVSTDWLAGNLARNDLRILDATWFIEGRDAAAEFADAHIPNARFLDLKQLADPSQAPPMMLPPAKLVTDHLEALGVEEDDAVILYDDSPYKTSARAWWMLHRVFGHPQVAILDGGLAKWRAEGRPIETSRRPRAGASLGGQPDSRQGPCLRADDAIVRTLADMQANLASRAEQVVDARGVGRFTGAEGEPRPDVTPGHIPGSINLPYGRVFDDDGTYKRGAELEAVFDGAGLDLDKPIVATCGSGVTAAVLVFAAHLLGKEMALYDGSWSEWGAHSDTPKASGAP